MSETATQNSAPDVSKYMYQIRRLKDALATAARDRDAFKAEADQYRGDNAKLKEKWDESALVKENETYKAQLKTIEYRKVWDRVAKSRGIREDALDAAYQLGAYKPAEGEIDENVIGEAIEAQKKAQTFLVAPKEEATTAEKVTSKAVTGSGQGGKSSGTPAFVLPDESDGRWNDNMWQWNHRKEIAQAVREKRERGEV